MTHPSLINLIPSPDLPCDRCAWPKTILPNPLKGLRNAIDTAEFFQDARDMDDLAFIRAPLQSAKGVLKSALTGIFDKFASDQDIDGVEGRQMGGIVRPSQLYLVGESGPELLKIGAAGAGLTDIKVPYKTIWLPKFINFTSI